MSKQHIHIAHSPDSDDAYMFWALKFGKVTHPEFEFTIERRDIEELNQAAQKQIYDITAISFHAYAHIHQHYALLASGSSFAERDYGPMIVVRPSHAQAKLTDPLHVAIPGAWTTSALLARMMLPNARFEVIPFEQIMPAVLSQSADAGLIIHEGQLQFQDAGLVCLARLNEFWQSLCTARGKSALPLPLGGNAVKKSLGTTVMQELARLMHASIACARENHVAARDYARQFKRDLTDAEADLYLSWYANDRTLDMGQAGRDALTLLYDAALTRGMLPQKIIPEIL